MDADDRVAAIAARSQIARAAGATIERLRRAAARASIGRACRAARATVALIPSGERVRLAGVVILTAALTNAALTRSLAPIVRPAAPWPLRVDIALLALALIVLAGPIARAWHTSRVRRMLD